MSKDEAVNLLKNAELTEESGTLYENMKMDKEIITFGDIEIGKHEFYRYKSPIFLEDVDINNILVSNKISSSEKSCEYFIGYLYDDYTIKSLHIMLPKVSAYGKIYDGQTKWM